MLRRRLPRGSSSLPQELIVEIQRQRLLEALTLEVAERGYAKTSVADIIARAGVSRKTFYQLFDDKEACYLAGFSQMADRHVAAVRAAVRATDDIPGRLLVAIRTYVSLFDDNPNAGRAFLAESLGARASSEEMARQWLAYQERFESLLRRWTERLREFSGGRTPVASPALVALAFGGLNTYLISRIRTGAPHPLAAQVPVMHDFVVSSLGVGSALAAR